MGCGTSKIDSTPLYNFEISAKGLPSETPVMRNKGTINKALFCSNDENMAYDTMAKIHIRNSKEVAHKKFVGWRERIHGDPDGKLEEKYTWWTYQEVYDLAKILGNKMVALNLAPSKNEWQDYNLKLVAIYSKNNREYIIFDIT